MNNEISEDKKLIKSLFLQEIEDNLELILDKIRKEKDRIHSPNPE